MRSVAAASVLLLAACGGQGSVQDRDDTPLARWSLQVDLDATESAAGQRVGAAVVLVSDDGVEQPVDVWTVSSPLEATIQRAPEGLVPTVAGRHELVVEAMVDGRPWTAPASLDVLPGPVAVVDLELTDRQVVIDEQLGWTVRAADAFGNDVDASGVVPQVSDPAATVTADAVVPGGVGTWEASARLGEVTDTEVFVVVSARPASIELSFDTDVEQYDTVRATARVLAADGAEVRAPWSLSVVGDGDTVVSGKNITFRGEGMHTVTATVDGTSLSDSVGPFLIDSTGPVITLTSPGRGERIDGTSSSVEGTVSDAWSGIAELLIDGVPVTIESDGSFAVDHTWEAGPALLEVEASDTDGNVTTVARSVLAGDSLADGSTVSDGALVRVHEGSGGLDVLESIGEDLIKATDLDDLIPSPLFHRRNRRCTWLGCVTLYEARLYVNNPSIGAVTLDLDPRSSGVLRATMTVSDVRMDWRANGTLIGIGYSGSGRVTAKRLVVGMDLRPSVDKGDIKLSASNVSVSSVGFDFHFNGFGWLEDVLDFFGYDVDKEVRTLVESSLRDAVRDELPGAVEDALQGLELETDIDLLDTTTTVQATPSAVSVDDKGLTLALGTKATPASWSSAWPRAGSYAGLYGQPTWTGRPGMLVALDLDFVNQLLYAIWGGGVLERELTAAQVGLDVEDLRAIFPDLTSLTIRTEAALPPTVVPDGSDLDLVLGGLHLELFNGDADTGTKLIEAWVRVEAGMSLRASSTGDALVPSLGEAVLVADVVFPASNGAAASSTEALLEAIVPYLLEPVTDALGEVPIPEFEGFSLAGVSVSQQGPQGGFTTLSGSLSAR